MLAAALLSFGVVLLAELGDKSQLITLAYALRYRWWVVLTGVGIASILVHGISVAVGHFLGLALPERPIAFAAAVAFLIFAVWTWRESGGDVATESLDTQTTPRFVLPAVVSSFVLAELGDKTMLATVALSSDHQWAGVWAGATVGMLVADGVAIAVGRVLHRRLPEQFLHRVASLLFLLFGLWMLLDGALGQRPVAIIATAGVSLIAVVVAVSRRLTRRDPEKSPPSVGAFQHIT